MLHRGYIKALLFVHSFVMSQKLGFLSVSIRWRQQDDIKLYHATGQAVPWTDPRIFGPPGGNVPSSQLTEHRGITSVACPHVAISKQLFIHSFMDAFLFYV
jgi:hypothetical protein